MLELRIKRRLKSLELDFIFRVLRISIWSSRPERRDRSFPRRGHHEQDRFLPGARTLRFPGAEGASRNSSRATGADGQLLIWSAGCSTGEEPYTLAMVLKEFGRLTPVSASACWPPIFPPAVLAKAKMGVFSGEVVRPVPAELRRKYFMRSRDRDSNLLRVVPELRQLVEFRRLNFMDSDYRPLGKSRRVFSAAT